MNFLNNMKVSLKLSALILIALIALSIVGGTGYYYLQHSNGDLNAMYNNQLIPITLMEENRAHMNGATAALFEMMITNDDNRNKALEKEISDRANAFNANIAQFEKIDLDANEKEKLAGLKASLQKFRNVRGKVLELALQNKKAEAYALYLASGAPLAKEVNDKCVDLAKYQVEEAQKNNINNKASFETATQRMLGIVFVSFVLLALSGFYITRMITRPLHTMVLVCQEFAAGDFRDKPRKLVRKDEIGQLADALENMRGNLRTIFKQVNESAEQVAASSEELTASAEQSAQASNQVAGSISEVATGAEKQVFAINETSAVVEQMSAGIQQVATNTNLVAGKSTQAAETAKTGGLSVEKAVKQMGHIEQTVNNSAQVVTKLGERSKEIGQIVDTISGIAAQTNLLALNAAIEAARAGEQGRGFAVVAEEVRKLAEQSQDAAKKIATLISEIQGDTDKAVVAMSEGTREVKIGTEVVTTAGLAFGEIEVLVTEVSNQVQEISATIQQMASGSQHIVSSVKEIDGLSKNAAGEAQTVSAATEQQSASMEEIASSSQSLAKMAQDLQEAVSHFRI